MNKTKLYKLILTSLFTALAFAFTYVYIPLPVGKVHLGNFVCIMSSFFVGPLLGGLSGAIGMGLADVTGGYALASIIRTIILKFVMGVISGFVFKILKDSKSDYKYLSLIVSIILFIITIVMIILSVVTYQNPITFSYEIVNNGETTVKNVKLFFNYMIPVLSGILFVLSLVVFVLQNKLNKLSCFAVYSAGLGIAFNIFGELFIKSLIYYALNSNYNSWNAAFMYSVSGLPSTLLTSGVTLVLVSLIFYPVYKAVSLTPVAKSLDITTGD